MSTDAGLADWVAEAMEPIGTITARRLFGGAALYCDGLTFAIVAFDCLWFKADAGSAASAELSAPVVLDSGFDETAEG